MSPVMKKLINAPDAVVREALEGMELAYAWIPVIGPLIGGAIAALLFKWFYP